LQAPAAFDNYYARTLLGEAAFHAPLGSMDLDGGGGGAGDNESLNGSLNGSHSGGGGGGGIRGGGSGGSSSGSAAGGGSSSGSSDSGAGGWWWLLFGLGNSKTRGGAPHAAARVLASVDVLLDSSDSPALVEADRLALRVGLGWVYACMCGCGR
jgi:hypothetical protein